MNAIFLCDDKMVMTFNFKEGKETIRLSELEEAQKDQGNGSDMDCSGERKASRIDCVGFFAAFPLLPPSSPDLAQKGALRYNLP